MNNLICLIESVKNHPKLFQNTVNNDDQDDIEEWAAVAEECKMTISNAQEQWNQLLIEYVDYLRSNQKFPLANHMDFLQPYFFTIIDPENIDEVELLNAIDSKKIDESNILDSTGIALKKENTDIKENFVIGQNIKIEQQPTDLKMISSSSNSVQRIKTISTDASRISSNLSHNTSAITNLTALELIFLGYAKQLQRMPLTLQLKTKRKIADIMDEAEMEMMN